jgi:hypothetical protein
MPPSIYVLMLVACPASVRAAGAEGQVWSPKSDEKDTRPQRVGATCGPSLEAISIVVLAAAPESTGRRVEEAAAAVAAAKKKRAAGNSAAAVAAAVAAAAVTIVIVVAIVVAVIAVEQGSFSGVTVVTRAVQRNS